MTFKVIIKNLNNNFKKYFYFLKTKSIKKKCEICGIVLVEHDSFYIWLFQGIGMQGL